jgi:hypothetical protein
MKKIKCDDLFKDPYFTKINKPNCSADAKFIVFINNEKHFRCGRHSNKNNREHIENERTTIKNINIDYMINAIIEHIKYGNGRSKDIVILYNEFMNKIFYGSSL